MSTIIAPLPLKVKFAHEIGTRTWLRIYWGEKCHNHSCHNAMLHLGDHLHPLVLGVRSHIGGNPEDYSEGMWPKTCRDCGEPVPKEGIHKQVFNKRLYDTPSGDPEPGSLWYAHWMSLNTYFDDQVGYLLMAQCPDGWDWCIDSRASNCTMPEDRNHRCWVRHGDPEQGNIHVDKNGRTCQAGAGSIQTRSWHGFLHNGHFV